MRPAIGKGPHDTYRQPRAGRQVQLPSGRDLSGCSDGFLLVLAPYADYSAETAAARITRAQCLDMNAYAADLATVTLA